MQRAASKEVEVMAIADPVACLEAGKCIIMTKGTKYIIYTILGYVGFTTLILFFMAFWTPAFIFLKAKWSRSSVIYEINRAQAGRFLVAKHKSQGIVDVKKVGPFILSENSHTIEQKSRIGLFFAFGEFAATLPMRWVYVLNKLRDRAVAEGKPISNVDELGKKLGLNFDEQQKVWVTK